MSQDISIIIVFEPRVILEGVTRDWSQFSQLGTCYIPQIVLEELEFLTKRAVSEKEEKTAREFFRFFPNSGWQVTQGMTHHDALTVMEGENLSKNARLQVAIAESVYYLTLENTNKLVVLVTNQQNLREEVENLAQDNLVSLTLAQFTQWLRTKQKPINVSQKIAGFSNGKISSPVSSPPPAKNPSRNNGNVVSPTSASYQPKAKVKPQNNTLGTIISGLLALGALTVTVMIAWYFIQPQSFQEFWQKMEELKIKN
ncbi:PIN domain-containing protein [Geminocystis sp. CENA526]|uniref:PIN domain-containing protein n=1 Tax=Geminocystis sp. CENA526 TaxID=1355871 RepID=UPI003D6DFAB7